MKRILAGIGVLAVVASAAADGMTWHAATPAPAARLGTPQASLATPIPATEVGPSVRPAAAIGAPIAAVRVQASEPRATVNEDESGAIQQMPSAEFIDGANQPGPLQELPRPQLQERAPVVADPLLGVPQHSGLPPTADTNCQPPFLGGPPFGPRCPNPSRWYGSAEYLLWWSRSMSVPVLLSTGPASSAGIPGQPGTVPLYGGSPLDLGARSGARFNVGYWWSECCDWGIDGSLFFLGEQGTRFAIASNGEPLLARPFFAVNGTTGPIPGVALPGPLSEVIADPAITSGSAVIRTDSFLWGADLNVLRRGWSGCNWTVNFLAGYRFLDLTEDLYITENFHGLANPTFPSVSGVNGSVNDHFRTANQFHGLQLGALFQSQVGRWVFDVRTKVALGESIESVDVQGYLVQTGPTFIAPNVPGGLLALNSNSGHFSRTSFAAVPEVNLNVGYNLTPHCRVFLGYTFLYWTNVLRPGDQVDTRLDLTRVPTFSDPRLFPATTAVIPAGALHPAPVLKETDFWAQGVNFGVRLTW